MKIGELLFELGFKSDTMKLRDFGKAVSELNMSSILSAGSLGAVFEGAKALIGIADDMALGINKFGRETGQSVVEVQKWTKMAEQMGVSAGVVTGAVQTLQDNLFRMKFTGEGSNIWNMLGLDPTHTKNMFEVLTMLRERLKGANTETQRFFLQQLGLSTELLNMFKLTDEQWKDIAKQQGLSTEQLKRMDEYHRKSIEATQNLKQAFADLGTSIAPISTALSNWATMILKAVENSNIWKKSIEGIGYGLNESLGKGKLFEDVGKLFTNDGYISPAIRNQVLKERQDEWNGVKNVNVNAPITIHSTDPDTTGKAVQKHLDKHINDAVNDRPEGSW